MEDEHIVLDEQLPDPFVTWKNFPIDASSLDKNYPSVVDEVKIIDYDKIQNGEGVLYITFSDTKIVTDFAGNFSLPIRKFILSLLTSNTIRHWCLVFIYKNQEGELSYYTHELRDEKGVIKYYWNIGSALPYPIQSCFYLGPLNVDPSLLSNICKHHPLNGKRYNFRRGHHCQAWVIHVILELEEHHNQQFRERTVRSIDETKISQVLGSSLNSGSSGS